MSSTSTSANVASPSVHVRRRRRQSSPSTGRPRKHEIICQPLPYSLEALDLRTASPVQRLASLRYLVLSYLAYLEQRLSQLETSTFETWREKGGHTIDDASELAKTALDMLESIRQDVCSHLPDLRLPDLPDVPTMHEMRSHLPDLPHLPDFSLADVRAHLPDIKISSTFDEVRDRIHDLDMSFVPILSRHLDQLQSHLNEMNFPAEAEKSYLTLSSLLADIMEAFTPSPEMKSTIDEAEHMIEQAASDIAHAIQRSFEGVRLITYHDLPHAWRNNPFVTSGYRFIPLERWPLIFLSLFALHNETLNIHTHFIPFVLWTIRSIPYITSTAIEDTPEALFMTFALVCLFLSTVWHTMAGCAHSSSMEFCARADYVGIGWLISASVGTVVYYGFQDEAVAPIRNSFLALCLFTGVTGSICPFMSWFNDVRYRGYRIAFFLSLAFSALGPLATLAYLHSTSQMLSFISPVVPSLASYLIGLAFYATHTPERFLPPNITKYLDMVGGGSHCIWHCFIVLAVSQHKDAIKSMKAGIAPGLEMF